MVANARSAVRDSDDQAPDLGAPEWQAKFAAAKVRRGRKSSARNKAPRPKVARSQA